MEKLNQFSLDLEFLLISVVQGVALAALATSASDPISNLRLEYFPYIISSFVLILSVWSLAIIHAVSFIDWPIDLSHSFLYFLASFIEVMAFSHVANPLVWFGFVFVFFIVAFIAYFVDLGMIRLRKEKFKTPARQKLYNHILSRQKFEMNFLVSGACIFAGLAFGLILLYPKIFIEGHMHLVLIGIQTAFSLFVLFESINSFKTRAKLVTASSTS